LANVKFIDQQAREKLLAFYRLSDVSLVPLKRLPLFQKVLPSKLFELMGNRCALICSVDGEAAQLVERAGGGLCIEPENEVALVGAILRLQQDETLRRQMSERGRAFVLKHYLREQLAARYVAALEQFAHSPRHHKLPIKEENLPLPQARPE
jgi:glycosyltransferase involved in cell wall biosynthesis